MHRQICGVSGLILTLLSVSPAETEEASLEGNIHALYYAKNADKPAWRDEYPSAKTCQVCHPTHYRQWSVSPHSYAQLSPVFGAMQETINLKTGGTNGDFCIRCHTPVGMNLGEKTSMSNIDRHPTSREGITCIVCHRINAPYGKISGRIFLPQGNLVEIAIGGPTPTNSILAEAINAGLDIGTKSDAGRKVHAATEFFAPLTDAGFCGSCHDVLLQNGFRLEEAFSEYKRSPAIKKGITCQDCHMGKEHGKFVGTFDDPKQLEKLSIEDLKEKARLAAAVGPVMQARLAHLISKNDDSKSLWIDAIIFFQKAKSNYTYGPAAIIDGKPTAIRKITNHMMPGPDHSIIHPGIYPHNKSAVRDERENPETAEGLATIREWLEYDHQAGWGQKEFELAERKRVLSGAAPT
ncbi:MAG: multiheme c-type cytochrome, partial [Verrucomicrobia bacterium]|nr:multiheme c-type cytochrome [Verrucomicrobiota bacterium]